MAQTAQQYFDEYQGQSLLYNTKDPTLRGQCVQAVCFYVQNNGDPVDWADAYYWRNLASMYPDKYQWIDNSPNAVPQPGDIIIWLPSLPGSGGAGHIAVCLQPFPGTGTFISVDQNWGGKTVHKVTHNYSYVAGWLRFKQAAPAPAPAPTPAVPAAAPSPQGGIEMIANEAQAHEAYQLLRPNSDGSPDEIAGTAGKRSWAAFASDATAERQQRDAALRDQQAALGNMQATINNQNATITDLTSKLTSTETTAQEKQAALTAALTKIAADNADLTTAHDQITDLNKKVTGYEGNPIVQAQEKAAALTKAPSNSGKLFASILAAFSKFKLGKK